MPDADVEPDPVGALDLDKIRRLGDNFNLPALNFTQFLSPYFGLSFGKFATITSTSGDMNEFAHGKGALPDHADQYVHNSVYAPAIDANGNAKIARALFEAQTTPTQTGTATGTSLPRPLTLDQIAARKQSGQGWGQVFQSMKAQGLVQDRTLGQVVSRYQRQEPRQVRVEDSEPSASVSHEGSGHGVGKSK